MSKRNSKYLYATSILTGRHLERIIVSLLFLFIGCANTEYLDAPSTEHSDKVVIHFQRDGGILPIFENWRLYQDGRLEDSRNDKYKLNSIKFSELLRLCRQISENYSSPKNSSCHDCYYITINLDCDGKKRTISILEGIEETPALIKDLIKSVRRTITTRTLIME